MAIATAHRSRVTAAITTVIGTDTVATASMITMDIINIVNTTAFADTVAFAITTGLDAVTPIGITAATTTGVNISATVRAAMAHPDRLTTTDSVECQRHRQVESS